MPWSFDDFDLRNWKITLPVDKDYDDGDPSNDKNGEAVEIKGDAFEGFEAPPYFFYDAGLDAMVFRADVDGATTSGSRYPRSELREMDGDDRAAWTLSEGGAMSATLKVDELPTEDDGDPGRVIVGQIHGQDDELVRLYYDATGALYYANERTGADGDEREFYFANKNGEAPDVSLKETFSYLIDVDADALVVKVFADGQVYEATPTDGVAPTELVSAWDDDEFYFKAGVYSGVNDDDGHPREGSGSAQAAFFDLDFGHSGDAGLGAWEAATGDAPDGDGTDGPDTLKGGALDDTLRGLGGEDRLLGRDGADLLIGNGDADTLFGDDGDDRLRGGAGADSVSGGADRDSLFGDDGADTLRGGGDDDTIKGGDGADRLDGGGARDRLMGGDGADALFGGVGADTLFGDDGSDELRGGDGGDLLNGGAWSDTLLGGDGADSLFGGSAKDLLLGATGDDRLAGEDGADTLKGGLGDDTLKGGAGADSLTGGGGRDRFVFDASAGEDRIADFEDGVDKIDIRSFGFEADAFETAIAAALSDAGDGATRLDLTALGGEGSVRIEGLSLAEADATDFAL
ncbi:MAG: polysaccharide lyase family 7 protein [Pseudomonadota bacterium]